MTVTGQLADMPTHGLPTRGLDKSRTGQVADWTTRGCHRWLCVLRFPVWRHLQDRELSSPRLAQSVSWLVRELTSPWVGVSASCPVRELAIRELSSYPDDSSITGTVESAVYTGWVGERNPNNSLQSFVPCCMPRRVERHQVFAVRIILYQRWSPWCLPWLWGSGSWRWPWRHLSTVYVVGWLYKQSTIIFV